MMIKEDVHTGLYLYCEKCDIHSEPLIITDNLKYYSKLGLFCLKHNITCGSKYNDFGGEWSHEPCAPLPKNTIFQVNAGAILIVYRSLFCNEYYFSDVKIDRNCSYNEIMELYEKREKELKKEYLESERGMSEFEAHKLYNIRNKISDIGIVKDSDLNEL
jgi:hypothetical protein